MERERLAKRKTEAELKKQKEERKTTNQSIIESTENKNFIKNTTVFIQYKSDEITARELENNLVLEGVKIERTIEKIDDIKRDDIRYSNEAAKPLALAVKNNVESFYRNRGISKNLEMIDLSTRGFTTPDNQIEIWIND